MICSFWNIRGLGQHGKIQCPGDFIYDNHIDFVCLFETKRENIDTHILKWIVGRENFDWHYLPAINTAGGILVGLKSDLFEVIGFVTKRFCIVATVKNRNDGFIWHLFSVYGTPYNEFKLDFFC